MALLDWASRSTNWFVKYVFCLLPVMDLPATHRWLSLSLHTCAHAHGAGGPTAKVVTVDPGPGPALATLHWILS
jgi:hypothetical protein